jgi:predicted 2-oxoglutarate/Fe(II)-dependent dioxygenase YbiX
MYKENFYKVTYEEKRENLTIWANHNQNPLELAPTTSKEIFCANIEEVPSAYHLHNLLSIDECQKFINISEKLGYQQKPELYESRSHLIWVVDNATERIIWNRCKDSLENIKFLFENRKPLGLNAKFRFYRYNEGELLKFHKDSASSGKRVINRHLIANAYPDRYSEMTLILFLNEDYCGGSTRFLVEQDYSKNSLKVDIDTPAGSALCFPHGSHPLHWFYSFEPILSGTKYIIRTDVLFALD